MLLEHLLLCLVLHGVKATIADAMNIKACVTVAAVGRSGDLISATSMFCAVALIS